MTYLEAPPIKSMESTSTGLARIRLEQQVTPVFNSDLLGRTLSQKDIYRLNPSELSLALGEALEALQAVNIDLAERLRLNSLPPESPDYSPIDRNWYRKAKIFRRCIGATLETIRDAMGSDSTTSDEELASAEINRSYRRFRRQFLAVENFIDLVADQFGVDVANALIAEARSRADEEVDDDSIQTPAFPLD